MNAKMRILIRVARRRIEAGETIDDILKIWTGLTNEEKSKIRETIRK